jgi:hypothetical protein
MTKEEISLVLEKVRSWPQEDQEEIAEIARAKSKSGDPAYTF